MAKHESVFQLGDIGREKITGIEGRIVSICFYETGCTHIGIKQLGTDKDGKPFDLLWFDEPMVDRVVRQTEPEAAPNPSAKPGGPLPSSMSYPR